MPFVPDSPIIKAVAAQISQSVSALHFEPISGGSINNCYRITVASQQTYFLKLNYLSHYPGMLAAEAFGLDLLKNSGFRTPTILSQFNDKNYQYLLLEWITHGNKTIHFWKKFGYQLAQLHNCHNSSFGAVPDNYIGSLTQSNHSSHDWISFFTQQRLQPQINIAAQKGYLQTHHLAAFELLFANLNGIFPTEPPSLLHGDLWSGNFLCDQDSNPILIDPAIYFGHRIMDLAMTQLFGGFEKEFYDSYHYHFPLPVNYNEQSSICQLYPLLVHLNLFGQSYLNDIISILRRFMNR